MAGVKIAVDRRPGSGDQETVRGGANVPSQLHAADLVANMHATVLAGGVIHDGLQGGGVGVVSVLVGEHVDIKVLTRRSAELAVGNGDVADRGGGVGDELAAVTNRAEEVLLRGAVERVAAVGNLDKRHAAGVATIRLGDARLQTSNRDGVAGIVDEFQLRGGTKGTAKLGRRCGAIQLNAAGVKHLHVGHVGAGDSGNGAAIDRAAASVGIHIGCGRLGPTGVGVVPHQAAIVAGQAYRVVADRAALRTAIRVGVAACAIAAIGCGTRVGRCAVVG